MYDSELKDAAVRWVREFNSVPTGMIDELMANREDDWQEVTEGLDIESSYYTIMPMWGWMWQFDDESDQDWLEEEGIKKMSEIGFRIYQSEDYGYWFGIDQAGLDFWERFWIPLYLERGLKWHERSDS